MGLLDGLLGNAAEIDPKKIQTEFAQILAAGERIEKAYQLVRDLFVFTDKRLIRSTSKVLRVQRSITTRYPIVPLRTSA